MSACTGACCAVFSLTALDLKALAAGTVRDAAFILDMLVELSFPEFEERRDRFGLPVWPIAPGHGEHWRLFTCRHWDETTRLCTVYEERPGMCRRYPFGQDCAYCGMRDQAEPTRSPRPGGSSTTSTR